MIVLSERDVRELLDMESCIEAMEDVLAALAREELSMPLRFVVHSPGEQLMGLMPAVSLTASSTRETEQRRS